MQPTPLKWHNYLACFFAGCFLANTLPHLLHGISGDNFPSPFSHPAGKGPSSPLVNVLWGLFNLVVFYALFRAGRVATAGRLALLALFAGFAALSIMLAFSFADKLPQ